MIFYTIADNFSTILFAVRSQTHICGALADATRLLRPRVRAIDADTFCHICEQAHIDRCVCISTAHLLREILL